MDPVSISVLVGLFGDERRLVMGSSSTQTLEVSQRKPVETTVEPRPVSRPAEKPFTIKLQCGIPA